MPNKSKFSEKQHKLAWKLYRSGKSFRQIAESEGMPSHVTISKWSGDYDCPYDCEYHNWKEKQSEIMDQALEEVEEELPDPVERDKRRLKNLNKMEKDLFRILEEGELTPPNTYKQAVDVLSEILNQTRLINDSPTEITKETGKEEMNFTKVAKQLNVNKDDVIEALEAPYIEEEGENGEDN